MEILFEYSKRKYAVSVYKNYCHIGDKSKIMTDSIMVPNKRYKRAYYFYHNDVIKAHNGFEVCDHNEHIKTKVFNVTNITDVSRYFKKYYNHPFSSIRITHSLVKVTLENNILSIGSSNMIRGRQENRKVFYKNLDKCGIKVNLNNGNITSYNEKKVRTNSFSSLVFVLNYFITNSMEHQIGLNIFLTKLGYDIKKLDSKEILRFLLTEFISKKGIKIPDNFNIDYLQHYYPTQKYLKRNDNKFTLALLDSLGIKSKLVNKIVNDIIQRNEYIDFNNLILFKNIFGNKYTKYLPNITNNLVFKQKGPIGNKYKIINLDFGKECGFNKIEKQSILSVLNDFQWDWRYQLTLFVDHIRMLTELRKYLNYNGYLTAKTVDEFMTEHRNISSLYGSIKRGYKIDFSFDDELITEIEKIINGKYKPYILKSDYEYYEEGNHMHHCVGSYVDNNKSIIISIRKLNSNERVTCEYDIRSGSNMQSKYFQNQPPPEDFSEIIKILNEKVLSFSRYGKLKPIDKIKTLIAEVVQKKDNEYVGVFEDGFELPF